ncbi:ATP-binding protein [Streptomyces sp. 5K101]|uniref:ATP-binding protein n=1 Tax=Streptomyces sp. 5K101 TaxID=3390037 RepID=UPI003974E459
MPEAADSAQIASWRIALSHHPAAVPMARAMVRAALADIEASADCDTAELLTAKLVANAVEHTPCGVPIQLVIELLPTGCHVEVHDADPAPPGDLSPAAPLPAPDRRQEHGRGLLLVRALSSD